MFGSVFFGFPDGDVRVAEGAVRGGSSSALGHGEDEAEEAVGGFEAEVEDAWPVSH